MITTALLRVVVLVEAVVAASAVVVVFAHAIWLRWEKRRNVPRIARARITLAELVEGGAEDEPALAALDRLPRRLRVRLIEEASAAVTRGNSVAMASAAASLGLADRARRWSRSPWWWRRVRGIHLLTLWGDDDMRPALLADRHPVVRSRAIEWAGDHPTPELVERVLAALEDESLLCRWSAQDALLRASGVATAPIARRLESASGRELALLLGVAARRPHGSFQAAAMRLIDDERPAVRAGAAAVLGALGGAAGTGALATLLADPAPEPRMAAAEGLGRLGHWPAAPAVAALLGDPAWDVRHAAGDALVRMGAPGALLLGHFAGGSDPDAAHMARYALDVASLRRTSQGQVGR
jgi:HEAT repeat protein